MRQFLPLLLLCSFVLSAQEVDRIDHYLVGTRITYFVGQCGGDVPEADGRLTFCDGAGNLGVVTESLGLSGRGVLRMLPNYFDDSEVYVTRGGLSIYRPDGNWENVPNIAVGVRDFRGDITNEGQIETGLVAADGRVHFSITSTIRRRYFTYDLVTKEVEEVLPDIDQGLVAFAYDVTENYVYALGLSFRDIRLYRNDPNGGTAAQVSLLDGLPETAAISVNNTTLAFHDGQLWLGTIQGLYLIAPADDFAVTTLNAENGNLPLSGVYDIDFADDGTVWLALTDRNRGALLALDLGEDTTYTEYVLPGPGNPNVETYFQDLAILDDGRITAVATNFFGYVDLDPSGGDPQWAVVDRDSLDALGLTATYSYSSVDRHAGRTYYLTNDFSTGNTDRAEVFIRDAAGNFEQRNDDAPANYSYWEIDRFNEMLPDQAGGMYLYSHFDDIISYVSPDDGIRSRTFPNVSSVPPAVDQEGRLVYLGRDADNRAAWNLLDWPFDRTLAGVSTNTVPVAYGNTVAFFSRATGELIRTINGRLVDRDTLPAPTTYSDFYTIGVGASGRLWLLGQDRGQGTPTVSYDPTSGDTTRYVPGRATGNPVRVLAGPGGELYFLTQRGLIYFDGEDYHVHTQQDVAQLAGVRDGAVDTLGRFFLLSGTNGAIHRVENLDGTPTFSTRRLTDLLPFIDRRGGDKLALDANGNLWVAGVAGLFKLTDELTASAYRPRGTDYVLSGRVYADLNGNDRFDAGEGLPNQPVAITVAGETVLRLTDEDGTYATLLQQENTDYRVTLTTLDRIYYSADRQQSVLVAGADRDYTVPDFRLEIKEYNSLYFQTANKQGAWGFERQGFANTFTTAVTNLSTTKSFRDLEVSFVYFNQEPGTGNQLPEVLDVTVTRLMPTGVPLLVNNITIRPRNHSWYVSGVPPSRYDVEVFSPEPGVVSVPDSVTTTITLDAIDPRETIVIEIHTDVFQASSNGVVIGYTPSRTKSPDLDGGGGNVNDNIVVIYPEPEEGGGLSGPINPLDDPNSPYVSPEEVYEDPPYQSPEEVYAPPPYQTPIFSSYDPNDKLVDGGVATKTNDTPLDQRWFAYTIRFENTGNFSAKDVWVIDTLHPRFLPASLTVLGASHEVAVDYLEQSDTLSVVRFSFEDVYLPFQDSINDGYVRFAVRAAEGAIQGDVISNQAAIYFDQNPPIITNVVRNRFVEITTALGAGTQVEAPSLEVYPNPAHDRLHLLADGPLRSVQLFDAGGRLVADYGAGTTQLALGQLPSGVYLLRAVTDDNRVGIRRVVIR